MAQDNKLKIRLKDKSRERMMKVLKKSVHHYKCKTSTKKNNVVIKNDMTHFMNSLIYGSH